VHIEESQIVVMERTFVDGPDFVNESKMGKACHK